MVEVVIIFFLVILLAFMAIPAFQKVHEVSQMQTISGNLRKLTAGANAYFKEHDVTAVHQDKLVGVGKYIDELVPVDGEVYPPVIIQGTTLKVTTKSNLEVKVSF